jgi:hypothetical protein
MSEHENQGEWLYVESGSNVNRVNVQLGGATLAIVVSLMLIIAACGTVMGLNLSKQNRQDEDFNALRRQYERTFIVVTDQTAEIKAMHKDRK